MRFFDFFRKLTGTDEDSRLKKLSNRISELFRERTDIEERQKKTNSSADTSWFKITSTDQISLSIAKDTHQLPSYTKKQKDWIRRGCVKWFYNISAMLVTKVPSEIVYTNISKMCFQPTRRKSNNFAMSADY